MKLSEALLKAGDSMLEDRDLRDLLREASALAKRVEDAPTVAITECNQISGASDYDHGDMVAATASLIPGQLVAIVPIEDEGER